MTGHCANDMQSIDANENNTHKKKNEKLLRQNRNEISADLEAQMT